MSSGYKLAAFLVAFSAALHAAPGSNLRVCADPDNMPYSNSHGQGFENELARFVGRETGRPVTYYWVSQRGKYFRALEAGACDVVMEAPTALDDVQTTRPYYRSSYVFLSKRDGQGAVRSFDDPRLKKLRIGVQALGGDEASVPPAQALVDRGLMHNITWYRAYQTYVTGNQPGVLIDAVQRGEVDVAIAWGPLAGYYAKLARVPLNVTPVSPQAEHNIPFAFDMSMGVRRGDTRLAAQLNSILERHESEVRRILASYGVPLVDAAR